jgi:hypothetical protein
MHARRDESGDVRHVDEEQRADAESAISRIRWKSMMRG